MPNRSARNIFRCTKRSLAYSRRASPVPEPWKLRESAMRSLGFSRLTGTCRRGAAARLWRDATHEQPQTIDRRLVRHRSEAEGGNNPADSKLVDFRHRFSDPRRRAVDKAVLNGCAGGGQVALRHRDPLPRLPKDAVAQRRARLDHRAEYRHAEALGFGVALGDKHVPPYPALGEIAGDPLLAVPGVAHRLAVKLDTPAGDRHRLHIHQKRPALPGQLQ